MGDDVGTEIFSFAEAQVLTLVKKKGKHWARNTIDDAIQTLALAGWQVYRDTNDLSLAKNRMVTRTKNLIRDHESKTNRHLPFESIPEEPSEPDPINRQFAYAEDSKIGKRVANLVNLTDRQTLIAKLRMAEQTQEQIAHQLKIGLRTVEREIKKMKETIDGKHD